jgi:hypothetical protein
VSAAGESGPLVEDRGARAGELGDGVDSVGPEHGGAADPKIALCTLSLSMGNIEPGMTRTK